MKKQDIYIIAGVFIAAAAGFLIARQIQEKDGMNKTTKTEEESGAKLTVEPAPGGPEATTPGNKTPGEHLLPRQTQVPPRGNPPPRPEVAGAATEADTHDGLTFEQAMETFAPFGYRYQFVNCRGTPGHFVMKQGVKFMLDNRDAVEHLFGVGVGSYKIPAYDFAIARAKELGTYMITCDGGGAAQMTVVE